MNSFAHDFVTKNAFALNKELLYGAVQPDIDECEDAFSHHFYNPVTLKDFYGSDDTAKNRCIWHFCEFLLTGSYEQLGRSLHFLEDICTPVHTQYEDSFDAVFRLKLHTTFEKQLDSFIDSNKFKRSENKSNNILNLVDLIENCALQSSAMYCDLKDSSNIGEYIIAKSLNLAFDAVESICEISKLNKLSSKKINNINVLVDSNKMYPSTIETNTIARIDSQNNLLIFKRSSKLFNHSLVDKIHIDI